MGHDATGRKEFGQFCAIASGLDRLVGGDAPHGEAGDVHALEEYQIERYAWNLAGAKPTETNRPPQRIARSDVSA